MSERRKTITWNLAGLFSLSFHKILILLPYFSVHNSVNLAWAAGNNEAEWLCLRRASPLGIRKASWCFAHTHQRSLCHSSSWIVIYFCTFPFSHPAFCEHLYVSGMELHPTRHRGGKPPDSLLSRRWRSKHWHRESLNLTFTWCPNLLWNINFCSLLLI